MKLADLIADGARPDCSDQTRKAIAAAFWMGQSAGQESAEAKIRDRLDTLPHHRFRRLQARTADHLLAENPCARKTPIIPAYREIQDWDFQIA
jgi:hypothetical protein